MAGLKFACALYRMSRAPTPILKFWALVTHDSLSYLIVPQEKLMFPHLLVLHTVSQPLLVCCSCLFLLKLSYLFFHEFLHYLLPLTIFNLSGILLGSCKLPLEFEHFKLVGLLFYSWLYR